MPVMPKPPCRSAVAQAAIAYAAMVFVAGIVTGSLRVLWLAPRIGAARATAAELPVMLLVSWIACGIALRRWRVADGRQERAAMGAIAFVALMTAEAGLATALGGGPAALVRGWETSAGLLGLAGQLTFAAIPLLARGSRI